MIMSRLKLSLDNQYVSNESVHGTSAMSPLPITFLLVLWFETESNEIEPYT
jgi:hypothetical protein